MDKRTIYKWGVMTTALLWTTYIVWARFRTLYMDANDYIFELSLFAIFTIIILSIFYKFVSDSYIITVLASSIIYSGWIMFKMIPFSNTFAKVLMFSISTPIIAGIINYIYLESKMNTKTSLLKSIGLSVLQGLLTLLLVILIITTMLYYMSYNY